MNTARDLYQHATEALLSGDHEGGLHAFAALCRIQPTQLDARLRVGDSLLAMGEVQSAAQVYTALSRDAAAAGYPLRALVALKILEALEPQLAQLLGGFAELYGEGSARIGRGARPSLGDPDEALPADLDLSDRPERAALVAAATQLASTPSAGALPERLPPIPLFSKLPADAFEGVLEAMTLSRRRPGEAVITQGEAGHSFYVLARGAVRITRRIEERDVPLATLRDGSIFGEMALVSAQPRTATVTTLDDCDLLEFDREALMAASRSIGVLAGVLEKFTHERLLNNLLATAPLFKPFSREQRLDLVRRFTAHELSTGTPIIREGEAGRGLFVILDGQVDVTKRDGGERVLLATLGVGDVFGEIALINDEPTTATVQAASKVTVLFLARELFQKLLDVVDELRDYVEDLGDERLMDTRLTMSADPSDFEELSDDDLIIV